MKGNFRFNIDNHIQSCTLKKMKKLIITFILSSHSKGILLYLIILLGNLIPSFPGFLRLIMFILLIIFNDWIVFSIISPSLKRGKWIKLCSFAYGTFIMILFITGPLFSMHNYLFNIITNEPNMPKSSLIGFFIFGFIISIIASTIWTRKKIKN